MTEVPNSPVLLWIALDEKKQNMITRNHTLKHKPVENLAIWTVCIDIMQTAWQSVMAGLRIGRL